MDLKEGYIGDKYIIKEKRKGKERTWQYCDVSILRVDGDKKEKIGSYKRNYPDTKGTFYPFISNGKELALYSEKYMYTRIMELPSCKDIGGEGKKNVEYHDHFCPVEYYVPVFRKLTFPKESDEKPLETWLTNDECFDKEFDVGENNLGPLQYCDFGFVSGCFWGDDSSWKIQFLDLSEAHKGIIKRDDRFGRIHLPREMKLRDAIDMEGNWGPNHNWVGIVNTKWFDYKTGEEDD